MGDTVLCTRSLMETSLQLGDRQNPNCTRGQVVAVLGRTLSQQQGEGEPECCYFG